MHNFHPSILRATTQILGNVDVAINEWLKAQIKKQVDPNQMVAAMIKSGKSPEMASLLVSLAMQGVYVGAGGADDRVLTRTGPNAVLDAPHTLEHRVDGGDRTVRKIMSMGSLDVVLYEDFLSDAEIEHLKRVSEPTLARSMVVGPGLSSMEVPIRTSDGTFLDVGSDPIVSTIEKRIENVTGIPASHGEGLQVLRYRGTQEYKPHFDFFEPNTPDEVEQVSVTGNRVGTMIFYLSDVEKGGATYFPQLKLSIHPRRGTALWFGYMGQDGVLDMRSEHAGLPIIEGEKWIATKWLRQKPIAVAAPALVDPASSVIPFQSPAK